MNIRYFRGDGYGSAGVFAPPVEETREIAKNVYVDLDKDGNLVSMTIEYAGSQAALPHVNVQEIDAGAA